MVEIRQLRQIRPVTRISMPKKVEPVRRRKIFVVRRRRVDFPPPTPQPTPCVLWQGPASSDGYGSRKMKINGSWITVAMHRWVMEQATGEKLSPLDVVLHACDNRLCYRFDHLSVGTVFDNNADMLAKGRNSPPPRNVFHGADHPQARLSWTQVYEIRVRMKLGVPAQDLGEEFGVSSTQIRRIANGERWAAGPEAPE